MLSIEQSPKQDPRFNLLTTRAGHASGENLGGKFALPPEFESHRYASAFVLEGQEVLARQAPQPVLGTELISDGWTVWKYPGKLEKTEEGKKSKKNRGVPELKAGSEHPLAGQPHKVVGDKLGENYVLMFRPIEIQRQVNLAYGETSRLATVAEVRGETLQPLVNTPGMLTSKQLTREERDLEAEREFEEHGGGRTAVVGSEDMQQSGSFRTRRRETTLHGG